MAAEVAQIRGALEKAHHTRLRFLIWAGMGGSVEDKSMYNAVGLIRGNPRCYALDSTDPAKLKCILEDMTRRSGQRLPALLRSTLVVGMAMGMTLSPSGTASAPPGMKSFCRSTRMRAFILLTSFLNAKVAKSAKNRLYEVFSRRQRYARQRSFGPTYFARHR